MGIGHRRRAIPNRVRVWRAERHVTQLELARKSGVAPSRISLIENSHTEATERERDRLARALKVDIIEAFPEPPAPEAVAS